MTDLGIFRIFKFFEKFKLFEKYIQFTTIHTTLIQFGMVSKCTKNGIYYYAIFIDKIDKKVLHFIIIMV